MTDARLLLYLLHRVKHSNILRLYEVPKNTLPNLVAQLTLAVGVF